MGKHASNKKKHDPIISYNHKIDRLTKYWNHCPKLQEKISLEKWLSQIKKPKAS
jgi:hypothetical protein